MSENTEPLSEYAKYKASLKTTPAEAEPLSEYARYKNSFAEQSRANQAALDGETDYVRDVSTFVQPAYQKAIDKVNSVFDNSPTTPAAKKLALQDKASRLGMSVQEVKDIDEVSVDRMVARKASQSVAKMYPNYVNAADKKSLEQMLINPEAVKQLNNSAKARAMKATTFEKFAATNMASLMAMKNNLSFLAPNSDFEEWAFAYQAIDAERKANTVTTKGTPILNKMWEEYSKDTGVISFSDIASYVTTDLEGFKAAYAEASNSAASIGLSIAGKVIGAGVGTVAGGLAAGPVGAVAGAVKGGMAGSFGAGAIAAMDEYISGVIDDYRNPYTQEIDWQRVKTDMDKIKNKIRIESIEQGVIGGAAEAYAPKIFAGILGKASSSVLGKGAAKLANNVAAKVPARVFNTATVKALIKAGKFTGKVTAAGTKEAIGEGTGAAAPKLLIDFQNGRLDTNKGLATLKEGVREAIAATLTGASMGAVGIAAKQGAKVFKDAATKDLQPNPDAGPRPSESDTPPPFSTEAKPFNERTPEETAASKYKTNQAEETLEMTSGMDDDADVLDNIEGMTDQEKVKLVDSANTPSYTDEDGVVFEGTPTERVVNGADIKTQLGEDLPIAQSVLVESRQAELAQAISEGTDFKFTYGEWTVIAHKVKDKHPTINQLPINPDTEMTGYEAVAHLSEMYDQLTTQYEGLTVPTVESTPPSIPGISAEMTAENKPITLYHGTNTKFKDLDYGIGGGMVFFGENEDVANRYANGAGGLRKELTNDEMYVETEKGVRLEWDGKNFSSKDGKEVATEKAVFAAQGWDSNTLGDYTIKPKDARVISKEVDPRGILDATTDEGAREILRVLKPTNKTLVRLIKAAKEQIDNKPGYNNTFSNEFWSISKLPGSRADLKDFTKQMTEALHTGVRFKDDSHMSVAVFDSNPAAISPRKQTGVVKAVTPTGNINQVTLVLIDGSTHTIDLYDKESAQDIQGIADKLSAQFAKALSASGRTSDTVKQASLQGIPVIMRVLVKRAKALGKPIAEMAKSIRFAPDSTKRSAYIGVTTGSGNVVYGVGRDPQRVSTVAHEFAHAILQFMIVDGPELEAQKQAGTVTPEGTEYLSVIEATAKLLGLKDISEVDDFSATTLTNPVTGKDITRNQSKQILNKRTVTHEKLATTMEVFLKEGHLKTDAMETEIAQILLYWRALIPSDVLEHKASVAATEGWGSGAGEYYQALDPSAEVGNVFHTMYAVNQQIDKTTVPMFNFSFFPVEMLGKGGQLILDKVIATKHLAIAKVFAKVYADSINARTAINTPQAIANMNKDLAEAYGATYSGELVTSLSMLGLKIPESMSKELSNIQELLQRHNADKVPFFRDATEADFEALLSENTDAIDAGDSVQTVISRMVGTFDTTKVDIYQKNLEALGYVTDDKIKQASEEMLAKALPGILNDQFTQLVAAHPTEAKQLFAAFMKHGKVSSRIVNKQVTLAAQTALDNMQVGDVRSKSFIKKVGDLSTVVVNYFNQGKYLDALGAKYEEIVGAEILRLAPDLIEKIKRAQASAKHFGSLAYVNDNKGKVHPETMEYVRDVLNNIAAGVPVQIVRIGGNLDAELNVFVNDFTTRLVADVAGKKIKSVSVVLALGEYASLMAKVAVAASTLEQYQRDFITSEKVAKAKFTVLKSKKVWNMRSKLPQANSVHEVFSTYYPSEQSYWDSAINDIIYKVTDGEAKSANGAGEVSDRLREFTKKSLSRKLEPMTLAKSGLKIKSRDDLIGILLYMGSKSGLDTLLRTHKSYTLDPITGTAVLKESELQADINDLVANGTINTDDIALANAIWAEFVPMLKMIQEVYRRDRGIKVGEVEAAPFKAGGFALTGGYFPISYNEIIKVSSDKAGQAVFYDLFDITTFRRTKERGASKKDPVKLSLTPITSYVNMTMREYHIKPHMSLFEAFINDPEVAEHLKLTRPGALEDPVRSGQNVREVGIVNDWISTVRNQVGGDFDPTTPPILNWILRNTSFMFYAFDAVAAVTNTVAGLPAAVPYSSSKLRLAYNALNLPRTIYRSRQRANLSAQMKASERQFVQLFLKENTEELYSPMTTRKQFLEKSVMMFQKVSQYYLERIVWNAEYETQMARGVSQEQAVKKADLVTRTALGSYSHSDRTMGQKAGIAGRFSNIASQHLFVFKKQQNKEFHRDGPVARRAYMSTMIIGGAITSSAIALSIYDWGTPDREKEEKEDKELRMKVQVASELIPYFLGPYGRIVSGLINFGIGADISLSPVEHSINQTIRGGYNLAVSSTEYEMGWRDYADVAGMATMMTGIPFSGITNAHDLVTAFDNHDEVALKRAEEDAERAAYGTEFKEEYNPFVD